MIGVIFALIQMKSAEKRKSRKRDGPKRKKDGKGKVDGEFVRRILKLIKIVIPSFTDPVLFDFVMLNISLVLRTVLSIRISG